MPARRRRAPLAAGIPPVDGDQRPPVPRRRVGELAHQLAPADGVDGLRQRRMPHQRLHPQALDAERVVLSTGEKVGNPRFFGRDAARLATAQRRLAKKRLGSKNRAKARRRVARIHARVADRRRDVTHQLSTRLLRENQTICVESLRVKATVKHPTLARAIHDVGWGELVRQLTYKAAWYRRTLVAVDRWYPSSKRCSAPACGQVLASLSLDMRAWTCPACGARHDRDVNAARNVLAAGLAVSACGGAVRPRRARPDAARPAAAGIPRR